MLRIEMLPQAAKALETALDNLERVVFEGQVHLLHNRWQAHELLGEIYWELGQYPQCYAHYIKALPQKPEDGDGWPKMLNSLCGLAIELGDNERLPDLLERLLSNAQAPLGMFFFEVQRRAQADGKAAGAALLADARSRHQRIVDDPEYEPLRHALEGP